MGSKKSIRLITGGVQINFQLTKDRFSVWIARGWWNPCWDGCRWRSKHSPGPQWLPRCCKANLNVFINMNLDVTVPSYVPAIVIVRIEVAHGCEETERIIRGEKLSGKNQKQNRIFLLILRNSRSAKSYAPPTSCGRSPCEPIEPMGHAWLAFSPQEPRSPRMFCCLETFNWGVQGVVVVHRCFFILLFFCKFSVLFTFSFCMSKAQSCLWSEYFSRGKNGQYCVILASIRSAPRKMSLNQVSTKSYWSFLMDYSINTPLSLCFFFIQWRKFAFFDKKVVKKESGEQLDVLKVWCKWVSHFASWTVGRSIDWLIGWSLAVQDLCQFVRSGPSVLRRRRWPHHHNGPEAGSFDVSGVFATCFSFVHDETAELSGVDWGMVFIANGSDWLIDWLYCNGLLLSNRSFTVWNFFPGRWCRFRAADKSLEFRQGKWGQTFRTIKYSFSWMSLLRVDWSNRNSQLRQDHSSSRWSSARAGERKSL